MFHKYLLMLPAGAGKIYVFDSYARLGFHFNLEVCSRRNISLEDETRNTMVSICKLGNRVLQPDLPEPLLQEDFSCNGKVNLEGAKLETRVQVRNNWHGTSHRWKLKEALELALNVDDTFSPQRI